MKFLCFSACRKFERSIGTAYFSLIATFSAIDLSNGGKCSDSAEEVLQSKGITFSAYRMVLAQQVFALLIKSTSDFKRVREFGKLLFIFALGIDGLLDSG